MQNKKENVKEKILIICAVLILIVVLIAIFSRKKEPTSSTPTGQDINIEENVKVLEDGTKINISNKLSQTKKVGGLEISNIQLTNNNGISVLLADVKNNTGRDIEIVPISITLLDKDGKTIDTITAIINPMKNGETTELNTSVTADYANAYDFTVKID